jgi:helicase
MLANAGVILGGGTQTIEDKTRGANLEFLLMLIRTRRRDGIELLTIALSPIIRYANGLERRLGTRPLRHTVGTAE